MGGQRHDRGTLSLGKRTGTHCTGGWVDLAAYLDESENEAATGIRNQDSPILSM